MGKTRMMIIVTFCSGLDRSGSDIAYVDNSRQAGPLSNPPDYISYILYYIRLNWIL